MPMPGETPVMDLVHPYGELQRRWRTIRMREFERIFRVDHTTRILDLGGDAFNWQFCRSQPHVTVANLLRPSSDLPVNIRWVVADALNLPFATSEFDVVFSNSVVEHVGDADAQERFASEVERVGRGYWVQTPNYWFPWEPHWMCPAFQFLPRGLQRILAPATPWALLARPSHIDISAQLASIRLLTRRALRRLFPDSDILVERVGGMPKSFIAYRGGSNRRRGRRPNDVAAQAQL